MTSTTKTTKSKTTPGVLEVEFDKTPFKSLFDNEEDSSQKILSPVTLKLMKNNKASSRFIINKKEFGPSDVTSGLREEQAHLRQKESKLLKVLDEIQDKVWAVRKRLHTVDNILGWTAKVKENSFSAHRAIYLTQQSLSNHNNQSIKQEEAGLDNDSIIIDDDEPAPTLDQQLDAELSSVISADDVKPGAGELVLAMERAETKKKQSKRAKK